MQQEQKQWRVIFLGTNMSKTILYRKLTIDWFDKNSTLSLQFYVAIIDIANSDPPPIGINFSNKAIKYNGRIVQFQLWGTSQQQRYKQLNRYQVSHKNGYIFVYDVSESKSLQDMQEMLTGVKQYGDFQKAKLLIGYNSHLSQQRIPFEKGLSFAQQNDMMFEDISHNQSEQSVLKILGIFGQQIALRQCMKKYRQILLKKQFTKLNLRQSHEYIQELHSTIKIISDSNKELKASQTDLTQANTIIKEFYKKSLSQISQLTHRNSQIVFLLEKEKQISKSIVGPLNQKQVLEVLDVVNLVELEKIRLVEDFTHSQSEFQQSSFKLREQCRVLEKICDHLCDDLQGNNFGNSYQHMQQFVKDYSSYKLNYCHENSISFVDDKSEHTFRLSTFLKGGTSELFDEL